MGTAEKKDQETDDISRSCVDCGIGNCIWEDASFPEFCLSTHLDQDVLAAAMKEYKKEAIKKVTVAEAEVEAEN